MDKIISATRSDGEFLKAVEEKPEIIFDLNPDIMNISAKLKRAHAAGKRVFIHIDLAKGIGKDESGIRYLCKMGVDGIISTKNNIIKTARENGLCTVQRFFIVDSRSVVSALESLRSAKPDMMEVMPGTVYKVISRLKELTDIPVIAGGLVETEAEVEAALSGGASAVSTGNQGLWNM